MSAIRRHIAVHGLGFTIATSLLLAVIAAVFLGAMGLGLALILIPAASPLMSVISAACGFGVIFLMLRPVTD